MDICSSVTKFEKLTFSVSLDGALSGEENMLRDAALFERASADQLALARIYTWAEPTVSLGKSQLRETALLPTCPIPSVMRPTGGGAVLHGHDLTVALACSLNLVAQDERKMKLIYRALISPLVRALNELRIPAVFAANLPQSLVAAKLPDCFLSVSQNDVVHGETGEKLIGCALRISRSAVLGQCSIPIVKPLVNPSDVFAMAHIPILQDVTQTELACALINALS